MTLLFLVTVVTALALGPRATHAAAPPRLSREEPARHLVAGASECEQFDEVGRMISLTTATLLRLGASDPSQHIFAASSGHVATLVPSRRPFRPEDMALLNRVAQEKQ